MRWLNKKVSSQQVTFTASQMKMITSAVTACLKYSTNIREKTNVHVTCIVAGASAVEVGPCLCHRLLRTDVLVDSHCHGRYITY
jgi:hypothetical protein